MNLSDDLMLQLALKHEKEKGSYSVVKEAPEFAGEVDLDFEQNLIGRWRTRKMLENWKELLRKRERGLSIPPGTQNLYMVNTPFEAKQLM